MILDVNSRIYFVNPFYVVMGDPYNGNSPVIVFRQPGLPDEKEVRRILRMCGMKLVGEASFRADGLWYHHVKEVGDG